MTDNVNSPKHYAEHPSGVECITITEHMTFNAGNAVKYLWRAGLKQDPDKATADKHIEDLEKAAWYVNREIQRLRKERAAKRLADELGRLDRILEEAGTAGTPQDPLTPRSSPGGAAPVPRSVWVAPGIAIAATDLKVFAETTPKAKLPKKTTKARTKKQRLTKRR